MVMAELEHLNASSHPVQVGLLAFSLYDSSVSSTPLGFLSSRGNSYASNPQIRSTPVFPRLKLSRHQRTFSH
jgi:hypothetical protein